MRESFGRVQGRADYRALARYLGPSLSAQARIIQIPASEHEPKRFTHSLPCWVQGHAQIGFTECLQEIEVKGKSESGFLPLLIVTDLDALVSTVLSSSAVPGVIVQEGIPFKVLYYAQEDSRVDQGSEGRRFL